MFPEITDSAVEKTSKALLVQLGLTAVLFAVIPLVRNTGAVINVVNAGMIVFLGALFLLWRVHVIGNEKHPFGAATELSLIPGIFLALILGGNAYGLLMDTSRILAGLAGIVAGLIGLFGFGLYIEQLAPAEERDIDLEPLLSRFK